MDIRIYEDKDYKTLEGWWKEHGWEPVPKFMLSDYGIVVSNGDEDLVAGFILEGNFEFVMLEWIVGNPKAKKTKVYKAIDRIYSCAEKIAKERKVPALLQTLKPDTGLSKYVEKNGWIQGDTNITMYLKGV